MGRNNGNGLMAATLPTVHLVLQGKGGIGKSVVASWLTEFLTSRGQKVCAIDADPVNRSLGQYKALGAEKLDLMNQDGLVERSRGSQGRLPNVGGESSTIVRRFLPCGT